MPSLPDSGKPYNSSSSNVVMTVCSRRAPMFSMRELQIVATRASSAMPSGANVSDEPSEATSAAYCFVNA